MSRTTLALLATGVLVAAHGAALAQGRPAPAARWNHPAGGFRYPSPLLRAVNPGYVRVLGVPGPYFAAARGAADRWQPRPASAGAPAGPQGARPRPMPVHVGGGPVAGGYFYPTGGFRYPSPLQRSVLPSDACYGVYSAAVQAGAHYALDLSLPGAGSGTQVYLADRWPMTAGARLRRLRLARGSPLGRGLYRWRFGISPRSYGSIVYIVVVAPYLCGAVPPYYGVSIDPWPNPGYRHGGGEAPLMQAQGPAQFMLAPAHPAAGADAPQEGGADGAMPLPGDLVENADFRRGLLDWEAVSGGRRAGSTGYVSADGDGLKLVGTGGPEPQGVRQDVGATVSGASALVLQARLKVLGSASAADVPALTVAVCYADAAGHEHCGRRAFRRQFAALPPGGHTPANVQRVPGNDWYQETFDLLALRPQPVRIRSLSVLVPAGSQRTVRVSSVHLLVEHERD